MMAHGPAFKSPLRAARVEACDGAGSETMYGDGQARFTQWRQNLGSSARLEAQQDLRDLSHEREHLKDLQADLTGVQGLVQAASQLHAGGARLAEVVQSSAEAAGSRAQIVVHLRDDLSEKREVHVQALEQEECDILRLREAADAHHAQALKLLDTYRHRLGLSISRVAPQTLRMAFSMIDAFDPTREFSFILGLADSDVDKSNGYCVRECIPEVPELTRLLEELNADAASATALPRFVCSMRRAFLLLLSAPSPLA